MKHARNNKRSSSLSAAAMIRRPLAADHRVRRGGEPAMPHRAQTLLRCPPRSPPPRPREERPNMAVRRCAAARSRCSHALRAGPDRPFALMAAVHWSLSQDASLEAGDADAPQSTQDLTIFVRVLVEQQTQPRSTKKTRGSQKLRDSRVRSLLYRRSKICCSRCRAASLPCLTPSLAAVRCLPFLFFFYDFRRPSQFSTCAVSLPVLTRARMHTPAKTRAQSTRWEYGSTSSRIPSESSWRRCVQKESSCHAILCLLLPRYVPRMLPCSETHPGSRLLLFTHCRLGSMRSLSPMALLPHSLRQPHRRSIRWFARGLRRVMRPLPQRALSSLMSVERPVQFHGCWLM